MGSLAAVSGQAAHKALVFAIRGSYSSAAGYYKAFHAHEGASSEFYAGSAFAGGATARAQGVGAATPRAQLRASDKYVAGN